MHQLTIHKLGPVEDCQLTCAPFMTFTGYQAAGKSTIAKAIFFFRTVKDDIFSIVQKEVLFAASPGMVSGLDIKDGVIQPLKNEVIQFLRKKFFRTFGSTWAMDSEMCMRYAYSENYFITISLREDRDYPSPNYLWVELSPALIEYLTGLEAFFSGCGGSLPEEKQQNFKEKLKDAFDDPYDIIYIPAGRSVLTLLSQQISYIFSIMDDGQKRTIDYCTQDYINRILRLKPEFSEGLAGLLSYYGQQSRTSKQDFYLAIGLVEKILRGKYQFVDGEERILLENGKYVKINFASSGQQEAVWILNLLLYYMAKNSPVLFIIEEPESHLFPESQKYITDLIALVSGLGHSVILTTHSPYVLGALNNLLYAGQTPLRLTMETAAIIPTSCWLKEDTFRAWFVRDGGIEDCMDEELHLIQNERIDEISQVINQEFDQMFDLRLDDEG